MSHYYINIPGDDDDIELVENTPFNDLYHIPDLMSVIFSFLPSKDLFSVGLTCRQWREITELDVIWQPRYETLLKDRYEIEMAEPMTGTFKQNFFQFTKATNKFDFHNQKIMALAYYERHYFPLSLLLCRVSSALDATILVLLFLLSDHQEVIILLMISKLFFHVSRVLILSISAFFLVFSTTAKKVHYELVCRTGFTTAESVASQVVLNNELMVVVPFSLWFVANLLQSILVTGAFFQIISWVVVGILYYMITFLFMVALGIGLAIARSFQQSDRRLILAFASWAWLQIFMGVQFRSIVDRKIATGEELESWPKVLGGIYSLTYICLMVFMNLTCRLRFNWRRLSTGFFMLGGYEVVLSWLLQFLWSEKKEDGWRSSDLFIITSLGLHFYSTVTSFFFAAFFKIRS
jgi:hypothetical protein